MDLGYFASVFIVSLGYLAGIIISYMAKEELPVGKRYFRLAKNMILVVLFYIYGYYLLNENLYAAVFSIVAGAMVFAADYRLGYAHAISMIYPVVLSVMVYETYRSGYFNTISILSFLYMMLCSGQSLDGKKGFKKTLDQLLPSYVLFIVPAITLGFLS